MRSTAKTRCAAALLLAFGVTSIPFAAMAAEQGKRQGVSRPLAEAYNASGQDLFRAFAAQPGNIVFSPFSIGTAMAMVLSGARGETRTEMHRVLRHGLPAADIDPANARALAVLGADDGKAVP